MAILSSLRSNLAQKADAIRRAEHRLKDAPADGVAWLRNRLANQEFVLFCGAGISVSPPSSAPAFLELRTSVMLALTDLLVQRDMMLPDDSMAVETTLGRLDRRADLSLPPELVFMWIRDALGFDTVHRLLKCCLDRGVPNANHLAIRKLFSGTGTRISGLITPNFDLYLEKAFEGIHVDRSVVDQTPDGEGYRIFKPHGSLDRPESIAVTIDRILRPLKGSARRTFEAMTRGRTIVVIGYSGWDYDLLPHIIHMGREGGSEVIWVLFDEASVNERVCGVQLALEGRCTIVNARRQPVLALLADVPEVPSGREMEPLRSSFSEILQGHSDDSLAAALINLLVPAGVPEAGGVLQVLCEGVLRAAESGRIKDDAICLKRLRDAANWAEGDAKTRAEELALECAVRIGDKESIRVYTRRAAGEEDPPTTPEARLLRLERDLKEFAYSLKSEPDPALAAQTIRAELRIEMASLLCELDRYAEAEALAREVFADTWFPESGVCERARIVDDAATISELHSILGCIEANAGKTGEMESHFCAAVDGFWRELQFSKLGTAFLQMIAPVRRCDRECARAVVELAIATAAFSRDRLTELVAIEWKAEFGFGSRPDTKRAEMLLDTIGFDTEERNYHLDLIRRMRRRIG
jgi:SIR2-like protein